MADVSEFRLITDLYDNVAIIDKNLNLVFIGASLRQVLSAHKIELNNVNNQSINSLSRSFKEAISSVLASGEPRSVKLDISGIEFLFFPSSDGMLLAIKDKVTRITKIESELHDRVKELECLYRISQEYDSGKDLDSFLESCTKHIEQGFPYPDDTYVNIELGRKTFGDTSWNALEIKSALKSDIFLNGKKKGEIKIYVKKSDGLTEEEQKLTDEVSSKISKIIEKEEETRRLEKHQVILTAKNEALIRMTEECYQKREKLKTFFRAITEKIVVIDRNFNIVMSNKDDIGDEGKCYNKLFNRECECEGCPAVETFSNAEDSFSEREFNERQYRLQAYPILGVDNNNVERVLEVCRDITDQKNMEAKMIQSYKLASLGKLVAGVAHEINNPNTFIMGNLKIVQEAFEDILPILDKYYQQEKNLKVARLDYEIFKDNITVLVNDMISGANRTKKIVGDLRNFAKKDEEGFTDVVDINEIIKNSLTLTQKHIKKFAKLELDLNDNIPSFTGNAYKLEQVVVNLMMNASEAIESGEGEIRIKTDYDIKSNEVLLFVSDNGTGMDEATLKNIFDPFYTTKRNKGGTGLGLSITYGIVKDHKGKIEVNSKPSAGTTFTIRFPVK